ncbi:MAG: hypothetical protein AAGI72_22900 [Pseudomonadota bacterium]
MATSIEVSATLNGLRVAYHRADPGRILVGATPQDALRLVPSLLPVCGEAQRIAAARALESAQGVPASAAVERERELRLLREQGLAAAWRLLVDWPRAADRSTRLATVKTLRRADDVSLGRGLLSLLPDSLAVPASGPLLLARVIEEATWGESCIGTSLLRRALHQGSAAAAAPLAIHTPSSLFAQARDYFASERCDPATLALAGNPLPLTVGPLAMARHPAVAAVRERGDLASPVKLLLAALIDTAAVATALAGDAPLPALTPEMAEAAEPGFGHSVTARGPLLHKISLDNEGRIAQWRHLAPTDWHFAPGGLVERLGVAVTSQDAADLLIAAADPCAPCAVVSEGDPLSEAA